LATAPLAAVISLLIGHLNPELNPDISNGIYHVVGYYLLPVPLTVRHAKRGLNAEP